MQSDLTILADLLFDGREIIERPTLIEVRAAHVVEVRPGELASEGTGEILDARGMLVMPGIINTHTHTARSGMFKPNEVVSPDAVSRNFRDLLRAGVTGVGEMGNAAGLVYSLRARFARSPGCGPDIFGCGPLITAPGGYPLDWMPKPVAMVGVALPCTSEDEARRAVRRVVSSGMDGVKLAVMHRSYSDKPIPAISVKAARAVVEESHALGKKVFCHAHWPEDYDVALEAGVDALMHSCFEPLEDSMVERVKNSGVFYCPTLSVFDNALRGITERWDRDPRYLSLVSKRVARDWTGFCDSFDESMEVVPSGIAAGLSIDRGRQVLVDARANFKRLSDEGVPVVFGTDASYGFCLLGRPVDEFVAMQDAGMSPVDCLQSATLAAAEMFGMQGKGRIKKGASADVIVVDKRTLEDVAAIGDVRAVVRAGKVLDDSPVQSAGHAARTMCSMGSGIARTIWWALSKK